jgi:Leucine-rich repeat (LRR) protein
MELVRILSKVIKENVNIKKILLEYPESTVKKLLDKFSGETDDTEDEIKKTISDFERFKGGFAIDEKNELKQLNDELKTLEPSSQEYIDLQNRIRDLNKRVQDTLDIFKYDYESLKNLTADKSTKQKTKKDLESIAQEFVTKHKGADLQLVKTNIKKYFELKTLFPEQKLFKREITELTPSQLSDLVGKFFSKFNERGENELTKRMTEKFSKENPDDDPLTVILPRVKRFVHHFELIPLNAKLSAFMTFDDFEHLVDGYTPMGEDEYSLPEIDLDDVDIPYEDDDILIFAPDEKQKCINIRKKYAPDRKWCTSWEGSSNYYYNYRLNQNLTLYYVISKNLPESDVNYAVVVLVDRWGGMRLADGTNSGKYAGGQEIDWSEIIRKVPTLRDKKEYLEPKPFSNEDQEKMQRYKSYNLRTDDPIQELGSVEEVELWIELRGPDFSHMSNGDVIFGKLPEELQRKYIGLGTELSGGMVKVLKGGALGYYVSKKKEKLLTKTLSQLTSSDIETIKTLEMRPYLRELKRKFSKELVSKDMGSYVQLEYPKDDASKYVALFGFEEYFDSIPDNVEFINIENKSNDVIAEKLPESIGRFTELKTLVIDNYIKSIPESIGNCRQLSFLNLTNNSQLDKLPGSISKLTCLEFFSIMGSDPNIKIPKKLKDYMTPDEDFFLLHFPENMKKHCTGMVGF